MGFHYRETMYFLISFDELLELSHQGNNRVIDMLVGDIYGGVDYSKVWKSPFWLMLTSCHLLQLFSSVKC